MKLARRFIGAMVLLSVMGLAGAQNPARSQAGITEPGMAVVTIVEFADFQCPFCARQVPALRKLQAQYPGKVEIVFKNFPLPFHAQARTAHLAALAAEDQGRFWEMHDLIFAHPGRLSPADFEDYAREIGLDRNRFLKALEAEDGAAVIAQDIAEGERLGITATPTLVIHGRQLTGVQTYENLKRIVEAELQGRSGEIPKGPDISPAVVHVSTAGAPSLGAESATITIVEFTDFQCPYCARALPAIKKLLKANDGQVRLVFKHFPLSFHADAPLAHRAALAAGEQGRFWEMHDLILAHQKTMKHDDLVSFASQLGLDTVRFQQDLASPKLQARIDADREEGDQIGVTGTPAFVIDGELMTGFSEAKIRDLLARHLGNHVAHRSETSPGSLPNPDLAFGPGDAPIKVEWYADLGSALTPPSAVMLQQFLAAHPGSVRVQFRNFPLPNREASMLLHEFVLAAAAQGKFWAIESSVLADDRTKDRNELKHLAAEAGLDQDRLWAEIDAKKYDAAIAQDLQRAREIGVTGAPTFVVGERKFEGVNGLLLLEKSENAQKQSAQR